MKKSVLLGYHRRSGSTLLMNLMKAFDSLTIYGEMPSIPIMMRYILGNARVNNNICAKPMDLFYLLYPENFKKFYKSFDKFVWITRVPMDTYLSEIETGYMYLSYLSRKEVEGIRTKFFERWKKVYSHYFANEEKWHLIRYEDLTTDPARTFERLSEYLDLDHSPDKLELDILDIKWDGGDTKILNTDGIHTNSTFRYEEDMTDKQIELFVDELGEEMRRLGYDI